MRRFISILGLLLVACGSTKSTDEILAEVWEKDQAIRVQMLKLNTAVIVEGRTELIDSLVSVSEEVERIDDENLVIVEDVLQQGLPAGLSADSYNTIWIVIDHASIEKQEEYLPIVEQMSAEGLIPIDKHAILLDRVAMRQKRPQRYGSQVLQFGQADAVKSYVWPVENPMVLDSLRSSVGMSPIADYVNQITETTGIEAIYNPDMTVEEITQMRDAVKPL
jgi:hypothetical protein